MKNLSFKQKFFIFLSVLITIFSSVFSAYYGLTNSRIEGLNSIFKNRPFTSQYYQDGNAQIQYKKLGIDESYELDAQQNIELLSLKLVTPFYTSLEMIGEYELNLNDFVGYFQTKNEIQVNLKDFEITLSPDLVGIIDTLDSKIIILSGLLSYGNDILESNMVLNYSDNSISEFDRSALSSEKYSEVISSMNKFKSDELAEIDTVAPELVEINLDELVETSLAQITITGSVKDAAKIFINNLEVTDKAGEKFSLNQTLKLGENFIDLKLVDEAGNAFTKRYVVQRISKIVAPDPISFPVDMEPTI